MLELIFTLLILLLMFYVYNCVDKFDTWFAHERKLPLKYQNHRKWWKF